MENMDKHKEINMYKYVGENNTLYDMLGKYYPELNGDYSTANFLNNINTEYADEKLYNQYNIYEIYEELIERLLISINNFNNGYQSEISKEQKEEMLEKFVEKDSAEYLDSFDTVEEYLRSIKNNLRDPSVKSMRDLAIEAAFKYSSFTREELLKYRGLAVQLHVYAIKRKINEKYKNEQPDEETKKQEVDEYETIRAVLGNIERMEKYDQYLIKHEKNVQKATAPLREEISKLQKKCEEIESQQDLIDRCQETRKAYVEIGMKNTLTEEQKSKVRKKNKWKKC